MSRPSKRGFAAPVQQMIEQVNVLSQRLVVEPENRDAILEGIAFAMKTSRQEAEEIMSGYLRQTAGKGHPHGFYSWMAAKMHEAFAKRRLGPDGLEEAAVEAYYRHSGGLELEAQQVDEQKRTITLGNEEGDSVTYGWTVRSSGTGYHFKLLEIKMRGNTVLEARWSSDETRSASNASIREIATVTLDIKPP